MWSVAHLKSVRKGEKLLLCACSYRHVVERYIAGSVIIMVPASNVPGAVLTSYPTVTVCTRLATLLSM